MKFFTSLTLMAALLASVMCSCTKAIATSSDNNETRPVSVSNFTRITTSAAIDVYFTPKSSGKPEVSVKAPAHLIDEVKIESTNGTLSIGYKKPSNNKSNNVRVYVKAAGVNSFQTSSAADIHILGDLNLENVLNLSTSSSGDIYALNLSAKIINMAGSSSGDISAGNLNGDVANLTTSSSADIKAGNITVKTCNMMASSAGDISLKSCSATTINVNASSSGGVKIAEKSSANNINLTVTSSSEVTMPSTQCDQLAISASSCGEITLSGSCTQASVVASSNSELDLSKLTAGNGTMQLSSFASVKVNNKNSYKATISSGAELK